MTKLYFGTVRDIKPLDNGRFSFTLVDHVTGSRNFITYTLTDLELEYLAEGCSVPYIFVKIKDRFYARILMPAYELDKELTYV